ncbi:MAG: hypothetical protein CL609_13300 [Anaerolineaceae bacterium]|nr:hypothetical protein [Anaerolineaceae bacterium]
MPNQIRRILLLLLFAGMILSACTPVVTADVNPTQSPLKETVQNTIVPDVEINQPALETTTFPEELKPEQTAATTDPVPLSETPTAVKNVEPTMETRPPLGEDDWQNFPILPEVSDRAREIYEQGLLSGTHPDRFSKIGDCQNINTYFLALYDDPNAYTLGEDYEYLQSTIDHYQGSWSRDSIAVKGGFNVASVFNPWFNNKELCGDNESPVECELRVNRPSVVLISMETWWNTDTSKYEGYLRQMVDLVISYGAVPILSTKADNQEGDHSINKAITRVAYEYDLPLWNFWLAVQPLPRHGVEKDGFHITHGLNDFSDPLNLRSAWPMRNLTALQALDAVWSGLQKEK